jgi:hypothetical protein
MKVIGFHGSFRYIYFAQWLITADYIELRSISASADDTMVGLGSYPSAADWSQEVTRDLSRLTLC